jgi:hypothetical protein
MDSGAFVFSVSRGYGWGGGGGGLKRRKTLVARERRGEERRGKVGHVGKQQ